MVAENADVAIVGAGIVGLMAARRFLDDGRSVLLLDRGEPGHGASFGNAGMLAFPEILPLASPGIIARAPRWLADPLGPLAIPPRYAAAIAPWLFRFWRASRPEPYRRILAAQIAMMRLARAEMHAVIDGAQLNSHVAVPGTLDLYQSEADFEASRPDWDVKASAGIAFDYVSGGEIDDLQPGLADPFRKRAVFSRDGMQVTEPYRFAKAMADHVVARGAVFRRTAVVSVRPAEAGAAISLDGGDTLRARTVVIAAGAWSKALALGLGDRVPLETERGYNTTLPPDAFDLRRQIYFNGHGFVVSPLATGVRVGGAVELGGLRLPPNFRRSDAMLAKAKRFLPGLRTEGGTQWMGFRPSMPDTLPVIGHASDSSNVIYAFGHGHLGLTQSAATGRLVSDLAAHRVPPVDLAPFRPTRFR